MSQSNLALFYKFKKNRHKRILIGITQDAAMQLPYSLVSAMVFQRAPPLILKRYRDWRHHHITHSSDNDEVYSKSRTIEKEGLTGIQG
jgi:hypothetical protein